MKIPNDRQKTLNKMDLNYTKELNKRENKLKDIQYLYDKKIKDVRHEADQQIGEHQKTQRNRVLKELSEENKRWDHLQNRLAEKKNLWEREMNFLEAQQSGEMDLKREKHEDRLDQEVYNHNKTLRTYEDITRNALHNLQESNRQEIAKEKENSRYRTSSLKRHDESLEDQAIRSYSSFNQRQQKDIKSAIKSKERKHQEMVQDLNNKNYTEIKTKQDLQKSNIDKINEIHNETIRTREEILKNKINEMEKNHQLTLNRLKNKNNKDINNLKMSYARQKENIHNKAGDPFYKMSLLSPSIQEGNDEYVLSLRIPEHEARLVNLTGRDKKLRLTTTRNFEDITQNEKGAYGRSARSEVISQEFLLNRHISPRKITQVYRDGMLIFKVPKN